MEQTGGRPQTFSVVLLHDGPLDLHHHPLGSPQIPHQGRHKPPTVLRTSLAILSVNLDLSRVVLEIVAILKENSILDEKEGQEKNE